MAVVPDPGPEPPLIRDMIIERVSFDGSLDLRTHVVCGLLRLRSCLPMVVCRSVCVYVCLSTCVCVVEVREQ